MIIRLIIKNKSHGKLVVPHPKEGTKLLNINEAIDFICLDDKFSDFIEQIEKSIKQNKVLVKLNTGENKNVKPILNFIKKNSSTIYTEVLKNDLSLNKNNLGSDLNKEKLKAFISYSTLDKITAGKLKSILEKFGISSFLAHEDIDVSEEWKKRILTELKNSSIFIPILSNNFQQSDWTAQEVGIIYSRKNILIIPLSLDGIMPYGFINHLQGKKISKDSIPTSLLLKPIIEKFTKYLIPILIEHLKVVASFRYAEEIMELIQPYFKYIENKQIEDFINNCLNNSQIIYSNKCNRKFLPDFINVKRNQISKNQLKEFETKLNAVLQTPV